MSLVVSQKVGCPQKYPKFDVLISSIVVVMVVAIVQGCYRNYQLQTHIYYSEGIIGHGQ